MNRKPEIPIILLAAAACLACGVLAAIMRPLWLGLAFGLAALLALLGALLSLRALRRDVRTAMDDIFLENTSASAQIMNSIGIPALLFDSEGRILWGNAAFHDIYSGKDITKLVPGLETRFPTQAPPFEINGRNFQMMSVPVQRENPNARRLVFQYWIDRTEALHYSRLYEEQMPTVALIYVDNYDELNADQQFHRNAVLAEVERLVSEFVTGIEGTYRRYENARFFVVFEAKRIAELEKQRFSLLDAVRSIETGTEQQVTLSIAVGVENRIAQADESARQGMELALGRGGDQAVVKRGTQYAFYGGKRQVATTKQSRVKARLFAKALRQLMEGADQVFVMGHRYPDMDCIGAALGLMRCAMGVGCKPYLVLDEPNTTIDGAIDTMRSNKLYHDSIRTPEQVVQMLRPGSVLIIVDTQRESSVLDPELYERAGKTVIIDHHRRSVDSLQNPTLNYLEAGASSTCEMVTEVLQYFDDHLRPTAFECSALLAGITMDTKRFAFNTGARTFEAAGYLRKGGADNNLVKLMYQDDMQTFRDRTRVVETALVMEHGIAISTCPADVVNGSLIAAQAADALLSIKGIEASFVLADMGDTVMISGRSLGDINVQIILERIGGGGHLTVAGAQLHGTTMDAAVAKLTESIQTYLKEVGT